MFKILLFAAYFLISIIIGRKLRVENGAYYDLMVKIDKNVQPNPEIFKSYYKIFTEVSKEYRVAYVI